MKFIKEYTLEDLSICDKFIELFHDAKSRPDLRWSCWWWQCHARN